MGRYFCNATEYKNRSKINHFNIFTFKLLAEKNSWSMERVIGRGVEKVVAISSNHEIEVNLLEQRVCGPEWCGVQ